MHIPVLEKEVLEYLEPKTNENFIDCTVGQGGHSLAILERILPKGKVLGIDWSPELIQEGEESKLSSSPFASAQEGEESKPSSSPFANAQELKVKSQKVKVKNNLILVNENFVNLKEIAKSYRFRKVSGILFDLGMSSWHLEESKRGFSFLRNEPLDMRYNPEIQLTAEKIINYYSLFELEKILREYGEERFAKKIAEEIVKERKLKPIKTTLHLVRVIKKATPGWYHHKKISRYPLSTRAQRRVKKRFISSTRGRHPATKTFQALRIAVNDELNNLKKALPQALEILQPSGRLVVISFHSLEDKIVKDFLKDYDPPSALLPYYSHPKKEKLLKILTRKPVIPSKKEIKINPASRSAKLRAGQKL